jgi:hypothetical protein
LAVIVYIPTLFILSREWAIFLFRRTERAARRMDKPE